MSRKPVHLERCGGKGARQRMWEALRANRKGMTWASLSCVAKVEMEPLKEYLQALTQGGYVESAASNEVKPGTEKIWMLVRDCGVEAPRLKADGTPVTQGRGTENMWHTLRRLADFNARELAAMASADGVTVADATAKKYIQALHKAGYLRRVEPVKRIGGKLGALPARYRLIPGKYTGPRPPMIQRTRALYDPNLGCIVWQEEPDHDAV
jgi:hypothetical protein